MEPHIASTWTFDDASELAVFNRLRDRQIYVEDFGIDLAKSPHLSVTSGTGTIVAVTGRSINQMTTGAGGNAGATLLRKTVKPYAAGNDVICQQFEIKVSDADPNNVFCLFGLGSSTPIPAAGVPLDFVGFGIVSGISAINFVGIAKKGGVQATIDTGIALDTGFHEFKVIVRETSVVEFFIDGAKVGEIATVANIPTVDLAEVLHMESIESAANNFQVDYLATAGGRA